jgi:hypothetical protein
VKPIDPTLRTIGRRWSHTSPNTEWTAGEIRPEARLVYGPTYEARPCPLKDCPVTT